MASGQDTSMQANFDVIIDILDRHKEHFIDLDYLTIMNAISSIFKSYQKAIQKEEDEDDETILAIDVHHNLVRSGIILYFENYVIENSMGIEFVDSIFNLGRDDEYCRNMVLCDCRGDYKFCNVNGITRCSNLQRLILKNPIFIISSRYYSPETIDSIIQTIVRLGLFSFDCNIKEGNPAERRENIEFIKCILTLIDNRRRPLNITTYIYIGIQLFKIIFDYGYLLKIPRFATVVLSKIREFKEKYTHGFQYAFRSLNMNPDTLDVLETNLNGYILENTKELPQQPTSTNA